MADGAARPPCAAVASGLIDTTGPAGLAGPAARRRCPLALQPPRRRWKPTCRHLFTEASDAFRLAVGGLNDHASSAGLAAVGRLADTVARARWLLEPSDPAQRRERGYALTAAAIAGLRSISKDAAEAGDSDHADLAGEIADRAATMDARLAELRQADGVPSA